MKNPLEKKLNIRKDNGIMGRWVVDFEEMINFIDIDEPGTEIAERLRSYIDKKKLFKRG